MTDRKELAPRLVDRDKLWALFCDHYWDSFEKDRDLILCHVEAVLRMADDAPAHIGDECRRPTEEDIARAIYDTMDVSDGLDTSAAQSYARAVLALLTAPPGEARSTEELIAAAFEAGATAEEQGDGPDRSTAYTFLEDDLVAFARSLTAPPVPHTGGE